MSEFGTVGEALVTEEALQARVRELAAEVSADYERRDMLVIGVLKGAAFFMADLLRQLTVPCELYFMAVSSYGSHAAGFAGSFTDPRGRFFYGSATYKF